MAKSDKKVMQYRRDGMIKALEIAKSHDIETLEKEVNYLGNHFVPCELTPDIMKPILEEQSSNLQDMLMIMSCIALYEEFGFRTKRIKRFIDKFNYYTQQTLDCSIDGNHYTTVSDVAEFLNEECKSHFDVEAIRRIEAMEDKGRK